MRTGFYAIILCLLPASAHPQERLKLATTTSTDNSGLLTVLHPPFEKQSGVKVDTITVGTGKALRLGRNGDVDVILVHAPDAERKFVAAGYGLARLPVMHNDFIILGPGQDPAGLSRAATISEALSRLITNKSHFVSRGDDSGTHKKELSLWRLVGTDPQGRWYMSVGQGMGAVLQIANDKLAYTLSDRGTYLAYRHRIELIPVFAGGPELLNPYHVIMVNPDRHPHVKSGLAEQYADFIRGEQGQRIIREFRKQGEILFKPDIIKQADTPRPR